MILGLRRWIGLLGRVRVVTSDDVRHCADNSVGLSSTMLTTAHLMTNMERAKELFYEFNLR